jgi:hypothetical protein
MDNAPAPDEVEAPLELVQRLFRVPPQEAPLECFQIEPAARGRDGRIGQINSGHLSAGSCHEFCVKAGADADFEHPLASKVGEGNQLIERGTFACEEAVCFYVQAVLFVEPHQIALTGGRRTPVIRHWRALPPAAVPFLHGLEAIAAETLVAVCAGSHDFSRAIAGALTAQAVGGTSRGMSRMVHPCSARQARAQCGRASRVNVTYFCYFRNEPSDGVASRAARPRSKRPLIAEGSPNFDRQNIFCAMKPA